MKFIPIIGIFLSTKEISLGYTAYQFSWCVIGWVMLVSWVFKNI